MTDIKESITNRINLRQWGLYFKIAFILFLLLLLMIPNGLISSLVNERSSLMYSTQHEIASTWGGEQVLSGPILSIPFKTMYKNADGKELLYDHTLYLTPEVVDIDSEVVTQQRKKGIYNTTLYTNRNNVSATFDVPEIALFGSNVKSISYEEATLWLPLSEPSAINMAKLVLSDSKQLKMRSYQHDYMSSGLKQYVDLSEKKELSLNIEIEYRGSRMQSYIPSGAQQKVSMQADWPSPGFEGNMLPKSREISTDGFTAEWFSNEYNRPMPEIWKDDEFSLHLNRKGYGVRLIQTVDHYQKNMRSIKYSLLIISLSFLVFFFFETLSGKKIHPLQYILIGLALSLFYLLLLSFSEHFGFNMAYVIAACSTIGLVSWYSSTMLSAGKSVLVLISILTGLYTYIYVLLQMEDFALLVGSIGLFVILATVMRLSKKLDWYNY